MAPMEISPTVIIYTQTNLILNHFHPPISDFHLLLVVEAKIVTERSDGKRSSLAGENTEKGGDVGGVRGRAEESGLNRIPDGGDDRVSVPHSGRFNEHGGTSRRSLALRLRHCLLFHQCYRIQRAVWNGGSSGNTLRPSVWSRAISKSGNLHIRRHRLPHGCLSPGICSLDLPGKTPDEHRARPFNRAQCGKIRDLAHPGAVSLRHSSVAGPIPADPELDPSDASVLGDHAGFARASLLGSAFFQGLSEKKKRGFLLKRRLPKYRRVLPHRRPFCGHALLLILLSGLLPNAELQISVLSIMLTTGALHFYIPYSFGAAASTRVSNELGAGNPEAARLAVWVVMVLGAAEATIASITLFCCRYVLGYAFSEDKEVVDYVTDITPLICFGVVMDSFQAVLSGNPFSFHMHFFV
ncbi:hypothetical protein U1Q18_038699 [Sarracenia purpurea var. burkii]